jgi:hypothetical protein
LADKPSAIDEASMELEPSVAAWTAELRRTGRLTFQPSLLRVLFGLLAPVGLIVSGGGRSVRLLRDGGQWDLFDFFMAALAVLAVFWLLSEIKAHFTERRSLTIDGEGVTVDGERLLWAEIDRVELNDDDEVVLHAAPTSGRREIRVTDSHVSEPRLVGRLLELEFRTRRGYRPGA